MSDPTTDDLREAAAYSLNDDDNRLLTWAADRIDELEAENERLRHAALDALVILPPERIRLLRPATTEMWGELNNWRNADEGSTDG